MWGLQHNANYTYVTLFLALRWSCHLLSRQKTKTVLLWAISLWVEGQSSFPMAKTKLQDTLQLLRARTDMEWWCTVI